MGNRHLQRCGVVRPCADWARLDDEDEWAARMERGSTKADRYFSCCCLLLPLSCCSCVWDGVSAERQGALRELLAVAHAGCTPLAKRGLHWTVLRQPDVAQGACTSGCSACS